MMKMLTTPIGLVGNLPIAMARNIVLPWGYLVGQMTTNGVITSVMQMHHVHMFVNCESPSQSYKS